MIAKFQYECHLFGDINQGRTYSYSPTLVLQMRLNLQRIFCGDIAEPQKMPKSQNLCQSWAVKPVPYMQIGFLARYTKLEKSRTDDAQTNLREFRQGSKTSVLERTLLATQSLEHITTRLILCFRQATRKDSSRIMQDQLSVMRQKLHKHASHYHQSRESNEFSITYYRISSGQNRHTAEAKMSRLTHMQGSVVRKYSPIWNR